jgi:D-inositol-3-phosphate glycosyltransferase
VPPGDPDALGAALAELVEDAEQRRELERRAADAAAGPYSWDRVAALTMAVYREAGA